VKRVNVAAIISVVLCFVALGLAMWDPEAQFDRALIIGLLALVAAVLSFRE
jgi:hypothetical protein